MGATGSSGRYIAQSLIKTGYKIKALVRDKNKANQILPKGIEIVEGNIRQISDLEKAMSGISGVYLSLGLEEQSKEKNWHQLVEGLKNVVVIARIKQVEHIITHFMLGAKRTEENPSDWWGYNIQAKAVKILESSQIPSTLFFCSPFMENFQTRFRKGKNIRILGETKFPLYWSSAKQVGLLAGEAFFKEPFFNKSFSVQGKDAFHLKSAAEIFVRFCKKEHISILENDQNLVRMFSLFRSGMDFEAQWIEALSKKAEVFESESTWETFGIPPVSFSDFAAQAGTEING